MNPLQCADEFFNLDRNISKNSFLAKFDGRVKIIATFLGILTAVTLNNWILTIPFTIGCLILAIFSRVKINQYFFRMVYPIVFATFISVVQLFVFGNTIRYTIEINFITLNIFNEGIVFGTLLFFKIIAAVSLLNLLTLTTPMIGILEALVMLKVPKILVTITALMLRYVFLFIEEGTAIYRAQCSRGAYSSTQSYISKMRNYSLMAVALIEASLRKSSRTYQAMVSRGHNEDSVLFQSKKVKLPDIVAGFFIVTFFITIFIVDKLMEV
jgi:cobalt/nickel transport system permease protein|tara:strand:+ start:1988 stop:2794 length:807 start_codon:yes stop_codon:yes gene_type:complete